MDVSSWERAWNMLVPFYLSNLWSTKTFYPQIIICVGFLTLQTLYLSWCFICQKPQCVFFLPCSLEELSVSNGPEAQSVPKEEEQEEQGEGSEDEWEQVGPRNKSSVTRQADFVQTPITDIFGGHIRYSTFSYKFLTCSGWIFLNVLGEQTVLISQALNCI